MRFVTTLIVLTCFTYIAAPWYGQKIFAARDDRTAFRAVAWSAGLVFLLYGVVVLAAALLRVEQPSLGDPQLWTARRFPLVPAFAPRYVPVHVLTLCAMSITHTIAYLAVMTRVADGASAFANAVRLNAVSNLRADVFVYAIVVGTYYLYAGAVRNRERERALTTARLEALQAQLQPHFLFNTLNSISTLVMQNEREQAVRMLNRLADLLRATLARTQDQTVLLRDEIELLKRYLDIETVRFQDRLRATISVPPELLDMRVPVLVLQPLVENAVRHGIAGSEHATRVEIRATRENGTLRLEVHDDGPGPAAHFGEGIGLTNTRARLRQLYGERGRLRLEHATTGGAVSTVEIPL